MLEKLISIVTAFIIGLVSFVQGPKKIPVPMERQEAEVIPRISEELPASPAPKPKNETPVLKKETSTIQPAEKPPEKITREIPKTSEISKVNQVPEVPKTLEARPIDLRSVVGLSCDFENKETGLGTRYRGSGVIIREGTYSKGTYILTNRHVVDVQWAKKLSGDRAIDTGLELTGCEVRILTAERNILQEEQYPYPYYDLRSVSGLQHDFTARLAYLPAAEGLSKNEEAELDYAILEITGKNTSKYFERENPRLPSSPILVPNPQEWIEIIQESRVVMPGYAFQQSGSGSFEEFRLLTKDGIVKDVYAGDKTMQNTPLTMSVEVPPDAYGGRSGSPIFYKGHLIGLVATKALPVPNSNDFRSPQPAITGIIENMKSQAATREVFEKIFYFE
ncbi:MAG: trypsin-like peptidase domain-containing protein [Nanoarchaeota archaeon]|nr:trypsin-like peptidase domain-containing protein [Nanoarchaeota archaeon]